MSSAQFLDLTRKSGLVSAAQLQSLFAARLPTDAASMAQILIQAKLLTRYHAGQLLRGRYRGFLLGGYKLLHPIGRGGMGGVFLAEHAGLKRRVAIKVLPPEKATTPIALERFYREARSTAALDHPNIVRLFDVACAEGVHFLSMEYIDGADLQSILTQSGPLPYPTAVRYATEAATGLQHAHDRGFIHRDVKPANLIVGRDGGVRILDMGLARRIGDANDDLTAMFADGEIVGTIDYMSPEQAHGMPLDARTDVYSLGATLFVLLTGQPPFLGSPTQKLMQHQFKDPPCVSVALDGHAPVGLSAVIRRMMAKKVEERYQSAAEAIDALAPWAGAPGPRRQSSKLPASRAATPPDARPPDGSSNTLAALAIAAGVAIVATATGVALWPKTPSPRPAPASRTAE